MPKQLAILCPITSRNCGPEVAAQPLFHALLPSMDEHGLWEHSKLYLGYDSDDPVWQNSAARAAVTQPVEWIVLHGYQRKITSIWNALYRQAAHHDYWFPANDDLTLIDNPLPGIDIVRDRNNFGTCGCYDHAFPEWHTFYIVGRVHFDIFGKLYPLPWEGAHQDPWIGDVYLPWKASPVKHGLKVHNRSGSPDNPVTAPRFDYGAVPSNYQAVVMEGRRKVNAYLHSHPGIAGPLTEDELCSASMSL